MAASQALRSKGFQCGNGFIHSLRRSGFKMHPTNKRMDSGFARQSLDIMECVYDSRMCAAQYYDQSGTSLEEERLVIEQGVRVLEFLIQEKRAAGVLERVCPWNLSGHPNSRNYFARFL